jgi:hypothetical protein
MREPTEPNQAPQTGARQPLRSRGTVRPSVSASAPDHRADQSEAGEDAAPVATPPFDLSDRARPGAVVLVVALAGLSCFGAIGQVTRTMGWFLSQDRSWADSAIRTVSYLTNLTIILSAVCFVAVLCSMTPLRRWLPAWCYRPSVVTAVTLYLAFVGCGYNLLLRGYWVPSGIRAVLNEVVHTIVPILAAVYWICFVPRFTLDARRIWLWLIYPLGYLIATLWRGSISNFYPYPFINVGRIGYEQVLRNAAALIIGFLLLMAVFLTINHRRRN